MAAPHQAGGGGLVWGEERQKGEGASGAPSQMVYFQLAVVKRSTSSAVGVYSTSLVMT
jgi:hypothetical protein